MIPEVYYQRMKELLDLDIEFIKILEIEIKDD